MSLVLTVLKSRLAVGGVIAAVLLLGAYAWGHHAGRTACEARWLGRAAAETARQVDILRRQRDVQRPDDVTDVLEKGKFLCDGC